MNAFPEVPYTGAAYIAAEAAKRGFGGVDSGWCNLGQGQPQTGPLEGLPNFSGALPLVQCDEAYGPVGGTKELRHAIADHYNRLYRGALRSRYRAENVAVAAGGRVTLARVFAALGSVRLGYQTPDYMAFDELLAQHLHRIAAIPVRSEVENGFKVTPDRFAQAVQSQHLDAYLLSNPCNPTGQLLEGADLAAYVHHARAADCTLLLDEFYSHYVYDAAGAAAAAPVSAAAHVEDVERDPILIMDGLTKNFRYPGWRIAWLLGPSAIIERIIRAATLVDGGASTLAQRAAIDVLQPARADRESSAVRRTFASKRRLMLERLNLLGVTVPVKPRGAFYAWGNLSALPAPFNDADALFHAALDLKVVTVPGRFFDLNPGGLRPADAAYRHWMRFSFGARVEELEEGLARLATLLKP